MKAQASTEPLRAVRPTRNAPAASPSVGDVVVRRVRPADAKGLKQFYEDLSPDSRLMRFLSGVSGLSHRQASTFCTPDHDHREGFVATLPRIGSAPGRIVGHVCLEPDSVGGAEVAIAVADAWQHQGLGRRLMRAGLRWARRAGVSRLTATMYSVNPGIHRLLMGLGLPARARALTPGVSEIVIDLGSPATEAA